MHHLLHCFHYMLVFVLHLRPALNRISVMRTVVSQLLELILQQTLVFSRHLSRITTLIRPPERVPEKAVYADSHADHAERDGMAANEARPIERRAILATRVSQDVYTHKQLFWGRENLLYEGRHDSRGVSESKLQSCCCCSFAIARGIIWQLFIHTY